ncbi:hypothetical protein [Streptomyces sp. A012304]|uniref:hypothetical protein n=1 Tax=Streptomyces sp. A012304 TaxID=375446 RepID=UPI00223057E3|nr:hypothetical protein [Streptomyces sp. A012304]GKQ41112.1 hypothetical protein ALMP_76310 [Streptomyces sp. A012304]
MARLTEDGAARLLRRAARRSADGTRGVRARWAWRRLVRACACGDAAAQEAVRTAELPDTDVLELLAAGPVEPADRAAYLTLIGQRAQRQALDPDGARLALAYWTATVETRGRLRAAMAAEGDGEAVRVVVGGEQRDRVAAMSSEDLDYLGRQLAEHRRWDELRWLALDLPLAKAGATARLLPAEERTGERGVLLTALSAFPAEQLAATVEKLPRDAVTSYTVGMGMRVSFSPDQAEIAVVAARSSPGVTGPDGLMETIRIATGESVPHVRREPAAQQARRRTGLLSWVTAHSVLHLGDELYRMDLLPGNPPVQALIRVRPEYEEILLKGPDVVSGMGRASTGVVAVTSSGLVFVDRGASRPRHVAVPRIAAEAGALLGPEPHTGHLLCDITTLPESRLIAIATSRSLLVVDEQGTVLHYKAGGATTASFLGPQALAFVTYYSGWGHPRKVQVLSASGRVPLDGEHPPERGVFDRIRTLASGDRPYGPAETAAFRRALTTLSEHPLDSPFATELHRLAHDRRDLIAVSTRADVMVTAVKSRAESTAVDAIEVHDAHLPAAREALEQPLLHATPRQWHRVRELATKVGDPEVRKALDLLAHALADRFGADVALGAGPVAAGGPHDIALGGHGER